MGTPGVRTNVPEGTTPNTNDKNTSSRQSETINNELSKTTTKVVAPTGEIKKLSVAVLVDGTYQADTKGERQYVPRSAEELTKYREIVKSAVGYNESRGDRVDVADAHFDTQDDPDATVQGEAQRVFWVQLIRYGGLRSPRRPLVATQNDAEVLERPFLPVLRCFCLAHRQLGWPTP